MKFVFIDTNIFLTCTLLEREGYHAGLLTQLDHGLHNAVGIMLLPEIVKRKVERQW